MARIRGIGTAQHARRRAIRPLGLLDPLTIFGADLELWLRSDSLVGVSGGLVDSWGDLSGKGNDFSEATFRLIYNASNGNWSGKPSIDGDGTKRFLVSNSAASTWKYLHDGTGGFFLVVYRLDSVAGSQILGSTTNAPTSVGFRLFGEVGGNQRIRVSSGAAGEIIDDSIAVAVDTNYYGSFAYLEGRPANEWRHQQLSALSVGDSSGAPSAADPVGTLRLGSNSTGGGVYLNGSILEVISASVYPSAQQFIQLKAYLDTRYGF